MSLADEIRRTAAPFALLALVFFTPRHSLASAADGRFALASGEVEISLVADSAAVSLERDYNLTLSVVYPASLKVTLPEATELRRRFTGFSVAEGFFREAERLDDGRLRVQSRWCLTPEPAAERYRLGPFAVVVEDTAGLKRSFATRSAIFAFTPPETAAGDVELSPKPYWVAPPPKEVLIWCALLAGAVGAAVLIRRLVRRLRRVARLRRMSPAERAFAEIDDLVGRDLPSRGLYKDFYVELTRIVRHYIERTHSIRAPEQTTEEFLAAAGRHSGFSAEILRLLAEFLKSADLVKFARHQATRDAANYAVGTAKSYVSEDAARVKAHAAVVAKGENGGQK